MAEEENTQYGDSSGQKAVALVMPHLIVIIKPHQNLEILGFKSQAVV
jgi:hypothetical protein